MHPLRTALLCLFVLGTRGLFADANSTTISAAEYFVDTDPGEGSGTALSAQDGTFDSEVESIVPLDLNVTGLAVGPHVIGIRYKDDNNTWGEVLYQTIHVYDPNPVIGGSGGGGAGSSAGFATIQGAEYFIDTDPEEGNGTAFQAQDGAFDSEVESILPKDLNVTGLAVGPHLVGVRYQDNNSTWGEVLYQTIHVYDANPHTNASESGGSEGSSGSGGFTVIAGAEYFIGNDPGEGNATALQPKDGTFDSEVESTLTADLSLQGYAIGVYLVGVRYMDNNMTWGEVLYKTIEVDVDTDGDGLADKAEAFYETNATVKDTDGDGYLDGEEVAFGSDPTDINSTGNRAPTDLNATTVLSILENQAIGIFITEFNATDTDANNTLTYSLADGDGSGVNQFFTLDPNGTLVSAVIFDYENNASNYSIRVEVSDQHGYKMEGNFSISLLDFNEAPTDLNTTAHLQVAENQPVGTVVGQLTAHDPDAGTIQTFTLVVGTDDNHFFSVDTNGTLRTVSSLDYEANSTMTIKAKVRDEHNLWIKQNFDIQVINIIEDLDGDGIEDAYDTDEDGDGYSDAEEIAYGSDPRDVNSTANTAPQITLGNAFPNQLDANGVFHIGHIENKTHIIKVTATDVDGDDLNYSIYGWQDLPHFEINASSGDLSFKHVPDFESANDHNKDGIFGIVLRVSDNKEHHDQPVWIWLVNENESPVDLNLTAPLSVVENQPVGTMVGQLTAQDPDANSTLTFTLVGGSNDNHLFSIDPNGTLKIAAQLDYESKSSYTIRAKVSDQNNSSIKSDFIVQIMNDPSDDFISPSDNNQTSPPIIAHNTTGDRNTTQPPLIDQNGTMQAKEYLAIVQTMDFTNEQNGTLRLHGKLLTNGGSIVSEKGFLISTNLQFLNSERISGVDHNQTDQFFANYHKALNGQTFFYRAFVRNNVGESMGVIKRLSVPTPETWWNELPEITGGWRTSIWFGSFRPYPNGWLYHADLGWLYSHTAESMDLWLWNEQLEWHWTAQGIYPNLFQHSSANWLYFITKKNGRPYFYDYDTGKLK